MPVTWHHFTQFLGIETRSLLLMLRPCVALRHFRRQEPFLESWGWKSAEILPYKWPTGQTRVPLGTPHNNGERRGGWWWKMDVCGGCVPYAALLGSNKPGSGSQSQIPVLDHQQESRKTDHKSTSKVSLSSSIKVFALHFSIECIYTYIYFF